MGGIDNRKEQKIEISCGCIIIENEKVLLIYDNNNNWGFPKGHMEEGETEVETAKRETKEETHIDVSVDESKRYEIEYVTNKKVNRKVVYFLARKLNGKEIPQHGEVDAIKWFSIDEALETLKYDNVKEVLRKVAEDIAK